LGGCDALGATSSLLSSEHKVTKLFLTMAGKWEERLMDWPSCIHTLLGSLEDGDVILGVPVAD
jgi:hypothetical protein